MCYTVYIDPDEEDVISLSDFGKTVFLTQAEAEEALKGMNVNNDLISRTALMDRLRGNVLIDVTPELEKAIQEQSTAYDVDKVVEQLGRVLPISFNTEMVRAILDGRKAVTRRLVKFTGSRNPNWTGYRKDGRILYNDRNEPCNKKPPYQLGDILYVRENWNFLPCIECIREGECDKEPLTYEDKDSISDGCFVHRATHPSSKRVCWRPSIHMPKEAARIWLKVTGVRVERLRDISEESAKREGFSCRDEFIKEFLKMYPECTEESWLWVIEFERCEKPESEG